MMMRRWLACCARDTEISLDFDEQESKIFYVLTVVFFLLVTLIVLRNKYFAQIIIIIMSLIDSLIHRVPYVIRAAIPTEQDNEVTNLVGGTNVIVYWSCHCCFWMVKNGLISTWTFNHMGNLLFLLLIGFWVFIRLNACILTCLMVHSAPVNPYHPAFHHWSLVTDRYQEPVLLFLICSWKEKLFESSGPLGLAQTIFCEISFLWWPI
jgi:hypothetical protein